MSGRRAGAEAEARRRAAAASTRPSPPAGRPRRRAVSQPCQSARQFAGLSVLSACRSPSLSVGPVSPPAVVSQPSHSQSVTISPSASWSFSFQPLVSRPARCPCHLRPSALALHGARARSGHGGWWGKHAEPGPWPVTSARRSLALAVGAWQVPAPLPASLVGRWDSMICMA